MDGGGIEEVFAVADSQKAGAELERFGAESFDFLEGLSVGEGAVLVSKLDDPFGSFGTDAADMR